MTRYILSAGSIAISKPLGYGAHVNTFPKRVPRPVREALAGLTAPAEVLFDPKTRTVEHVPYWQRSHDW